MIVRHKEVNIIGVKRKAKTLDTYIHIYESGSFRLLESSGELWKMLSGIELQPSAAGLLCDIIIPPTLYDKFLVASSKSGIQSHCYYKDPDFEELKKVLCKIYRNHVGNRQKISKEDKLKRNNYEENGIALVATDEKLEKPYMPMIEGKKYMFMYNMKASQYKDIIFENIELKKKDSMSTERIKVLEKRVEELESKYNVKKRA